MKNLFAIDQTRKTTPSALRQQRVEARYIPALATKTDYPAIDGVVYLSDRAGGFFALGYIGHKQNPSFNFRFRTEEHRAQYIARWVTETLAITTRKRERAEEKRNAVHTLKVGDVLYGTWGWEQTNVEYFEVVGIVSDKTIEIKSIAHSTTTTGFDCGDTIPIQGRFTSPVMRCRAIGNRISSGKGRLCGAGLWDGKSVGATWYA
jgi:hypothetical protein